MSRSRFRRPTPGSAPVVDQSSAVRPGDEIGGYRLVRKLGEGRRATVYLGFADAEQPSGNDDELVPEAVAVKVFHSSVDAASRNTELEALARSTHPHALRLLDLAMTADGAHCAIVERLPRGSLAQLVAARGELLAGEAVTILAPIVSAVGELHASGVVHGGVGTSAVLFRESGAPVLASFGAAQLISPDQPAAVLDDDPRVTRDRATTAALVSAVIERIGRSDAAAPGVAEFASWLEPATLSANFFVECERRLFALSAPQPVAFGAVDVASDRWPEPRVVATRPAEEAGPGLKLANVIAATGKRARAVRTALSTVRKPVWIVAFLVVFGVVSVLALDSGGSAEPAEERRSSAPAATPVPTDQSAAVTGDDPLAAVSELLALRRACYAQISVLCLDQVDQVGSTAMQKDAARIREIQDGGELDRIDLTTGRLRLVERLGDSALVDLGVTVNDALTSEPASLLVMRGKAGWRIRDYLEE